MTDLTREVRRLAVPAIVGSLLGTLVFVVDRIMLGAHGEASLAAMQLGGPIEWSIWSVFSAFEIGTIARVGRHVGAKKPGAARRTAWISLAIAAFFGSLLAIVSPLLLLGLPLVAKNASPASLIEAQRYLSVTMAASPVVFVAITSIAVLTASGDTRTPLVVGIIGNVIHVGLNRALILGIPGVVPALGARGAGISTSITFVVFAVLATGALARTSRPVSLRTRLDEEPKTALEDEARSLASVALPAFLERVIYHVGFLAYALMVAQLGEAAMAANQALISVESICFLSADGFAVASAALVAQKLGANEPEQARRAATIATRDAVVVLTTFGLAAYALRDVILPVFSADQEVLAIGRSTVWVLVIAQPFMAIGLVLAQSLRGAGRTREALAVSAASAVLVRVSLTYVFAIHWKLGLVGIWLGSTCDWLVRSALYGLIGVRRLTA